MTKSYADFTSDILAASRLLPPKTTMMQSILTQEKPNEEHERISITYHYTPPEALVFGLPQGASIEQQKLYQDQEHGQPSTTVPISVIVDFCGTSLHTSLFPILFIAN